MNAVEEFIQSGEKPVPASDSQQIMMNGQSEPYEGELYERLGDLERKLKICTEKFFQIEEKNMPQLKEDIQEQIQDHQEKIES